METFSQTTKRLMAERKLSHADAQNEAIKLRANGGVGSPSDARDPRLKSGEIAIDGSHAVRLADVVKLTPSQLAKALERQMKISHAEAQCLAARIREEAGFVILTEEGSAALGVRRAG